MCRCTFFTEYKRIGLRKIRSLAWKKANRMQVTFHIQMEKNGSEKWSNKVICSKLGKNKKRTDGYTSYQFISTLE